MFCKSSSNKSSQPILETEKLKKLVMELDEHKQATISGGSVGTDKGGLAYEPHKLSVTALVLLFANPFA